MSKTSKSRELGYYDSDDFAGGVAVVTSDTVDLAAASRGLYIGGAGALKVTMADGSVLTFSGVTAGTIFPIIVTRVWAIGTTATNIISLI